MARITSWALVACVALGFAFPASARESRTEYPLKEALAVGYERGKIERDVKLFFGDQGHGPVARNLGEFTTSQKTNSFGKTDVKACRWAFFSAITSLQKRARLEGGNAVINIKSNNKHIEFSSAKEFQCLAGNVVAGVALKGDVVRLAE